MLRFGRDDRVILVRQRSRWLPPTLAQNAKMGHPSVDSGGKEQQRVVLLSSYSGWGDVVFDDAVQVDAVLFLEGGWGAVVEEVPGFAVVLPLVLVVAGTDADGVFFGGYLGWDDVPDIFGNAVDG
jgi:hypothetical protein